jgi:hypothetical protein
VIRVVGPGLFVDGDDDGYYLVLRSLTRPSKNPQDVCFYGPFSTAAQASFMAASARALGLTPHEPEPGPAAPEFEVAREAAVAAAPVQRIPAP